jgi:hypothetical protein
MFFVGEEFEEIGGYPLRFLVCLYSQAAVDWIISRPGRSSTNVIASANDQKLGEIRRAE